MLIFKHKKASGKSMDLTSKEVAKLLNVSETTIRRWVVEGILPAYTIKNQLRFSQIEIENWLTEQKKQNIIGLNSPEVEKILTHQMGTQVFSLYRALSKGGVLYDVGGENKKEVFQKSLKSIAGNLHLDDSVLFELLWDREKLMPTSLNHGVGVPHTRDFLFSKPYDVVTIVFPKKRDRRLWRFRWKKSTYTFFSICL